MPSPRLVDYEPAMTPRLVAMWRQSFEEAVGVADLHPVAEQLAYLERQVVPVNAVKGLLDGEEIVGFVAASAESTAQLYVRRGFEPHWRLEDVCFEWRRDA